MNEINDLIFNLMIDLKKKEINPFTRAKLIKRYMMQTKTSIRQLSKELDIPLATLHGWISYDNIEEEDYNELIKQGYKKTELFQNIKTNTEIINKNNIENDIKTLQHSQDTFLSINEKLKRDIVKYNLLIKYLDSHKINNETKLLVDELISSLNKIIRIEIVV